MDGEVKCPLVWVSDEALTRDHYFLLTNRKTGDSGSPFIVKSARGPTIVAIQRAIEGSCQTPNRDILRHEILAVAVARVLRWILRTITTLTRCHCMEELVERFARHSEGR